MGFCPKTPMRYVRVPAMVLQGCLLIALLASGAVTDGWVQRYTNPTTRIAPGEPVKVVVFGA